jgi:hypothetical protein
MTAISQICHDLTIQNMSVEERIETVCRLAKSGQIHGLSYDSELGLSIDPEDELADFLDGMLY